MRQRSTRSRKTSKLSSRKVSIMAQPSGQRRRVPTKRIVIAQKKLSMRMDVLDTLFKWMAERDRIRRKRLAGHPAPWSEDIVFQEHKFCNVYRVYDRGTQYLLREVINKGDQNHLEICFRVILFKLFNRITTWELLVKRLGPLTWASFDLAAYGAVLAFAKQSSPLYTSAYQIPAPKLGYNEGFMNHLRLLQLMMEGDVPGQLLQREHMRDAYDIITLYPGMGPFLAYQLLLDLNLSPHLNYPENEWTACGPGSTNCLRLIFGNDVLGLESDAIAYLYSTQVEHFTRLGISDPPRMHDGHSGVTFVDIEHSLCEVSKYYRYCGVRGAWKASKEPTTNDLPTTRIIAMSTTTEEAPSSPLSELPDDNADDMDLSYEVSHIVKERSGSGSREYKVRWTGYGPKADTWLSAVELRNAPYVLKEWRDLRRIETGIKRRIEELVHTGGNELTECI